MKHPAVLQFGKLSDLKARDAKKCIAKHRKSPFSKLRFMDFVDLSAGSDDEPIGIYLFCDESGKCRYVGNNGSRCFVERIAAHLDFRERAFMSHLIKVLRTKKNSAGNVEIAAQIGCLNLLLVSGIPKEKIGKVERILKRLLEPDLNNLRIGHRKLAENELDRTLANLVS